MENVETPVLGENAGPGSRLFFIADGEHLRQMGTTTGVHTAFIIGGRVVTVGATEIEARAIPLQRRR